MNPKIWIEPTGSTLRLVWYYQGKRQRLSLRVPDNASGRAFAAIKIAKISMDMVSGHYDPTLLEYRPLAMGKNSTEITTVELFDRFTQHQLKHKGLSQNSINTRYKFLQRMLEKHLNIRACDVEKRRVEAFAAVCRDTLKPDTAKQRIWLLKSAWDWGKGKYQLADENPWVGIAERFKSVPVQPCAVFSKEEVKQIIQGFRDSPYYAYYTDYVVFRFGVGTRTEEASNLKWRHISPDYSSVWIESSKTKKARTVVMPTSISMMLKARKEASKPQSDDELVFTTPTGLLVNSRDFNRRAWKKILAQKEIPYRKPYTTRKTAGSHAIDAGANYLEVAEALGHNPHTMHKYYAEVIQKKSVFVSFE